jgi:MFS family permease
MSVLRNPAVESAPSGPPLFTRHVYLVLATQALFGLAWSVFLMLPKFLTVSLGADSASIGYVSAMSGLAAVLTVPVVTQLIDRLGRRPLLQIGCIVLALVSSGFLWVDRLSALVFVLAAGTSSAFVFAYNASATLVTDAAPPERLGQVLAILGAANAMTNSIATLAAERIAHQVGWSPVFVLAAAVALVALGATFAINEPRRKATREGGDTDQASGTSGSSLRVLVVSMLVGAVFAAMFAFHQPYAISLGATDVAPFFAGFTVATVVVRAVLGTAGDRFGHRRVATLASLAYGAVALATADLHARSLWAYGTGFGLAHGVLYPTLNALAVELVPARKRGRIITLFNGAFNAGYGASTLVWGNVASHLGYPPLFVLAAGLGLLSAGLLAVDRPRRSSPEP